MKISGIGLPYDPFADTIPLSTRAPKWAKTLRLYPNPGSGDVWFSGVEGRLELNLFATDGRRVFEGWAGSGSPVSLANLPSGMYTYLARKGDQKWIGRWINE
ncbi:MAG TPA: T9SS type A sorting domain-containing protein [Catalimonadaceae bacterium]|nr:T9SS type A sorting domain-containing protein [Catalimonadaceae bacterium]HPI09654.1 T9SS type A sorting domain-containing protein [Catalimonadaceae bacterium]